MKYNFFPLFSGPSSSIILNETAEFCRNLGARQFNDFEERKRANKDKKDDEDHVDDELLDFEESLKSKETRQYEESRMRLVLIGI